MNRLYLLDTKTLSYIVKDKPKAARERLSSLKAGEIACISTITEAELLYGVAKSSAGEQRRNAITWFSLASKSLPGTGKPPRPMASFAQSRSGSVKRSAHSTCRSLPTPSPSVLFWLPATKPYNGLPISQTSRTGQTMQSS